MGDVISSKLTSKLRSICSWVKFNKDGLVVTFGLISFLKDLVSCDAKPCRPIWDPIKCPKYDGVFIRNITSEILKDTRLSETLTNVVIPSFDEKKVKPVVFSKLKVSMVEIKCVYYILI